MRLFKPSTESSLGAIVVLTILTASCATKKWVRNNFAEPMDARINALDKKVSGNKKETDNRITEVDQNAEHGIANAQAAAEKADQAATDAAKQAQGANDLAQKGVDQVNKVSETLENITNYQTVKTGTVLFRVNRAELTAEGQQTLDALVQDLPSFKHYAIAVQGHTDHTGSKTYNLQLSGRRANAVVRYLTAEKNVPLVRIFYLGYGEEKPAAPNRTRKGREENRRVDVTILTPQGSGSETSARTTNPLNQ
jgi:OmpA-OmpF porin, OOP family